MTKDQKQIDAQRAVIKALQETISAQERTIVAKTGCWSLQIVKRSDAHRFVVLPKHDFSQRPFLIFTTVLSGT